MTQTQLDELNARTRALESTTATLQLLDNMNQSVSTATLQSLVVRQAIALTEFVSPNVHKAGH